MDGWMNGWLTEHEYGLDSVVEHAYGAIERALQVRRHLARLVVQHLSLRPAADGDEELVQ